MGSGAGKSRGRCVRRGAASTGAQARTTSPHGFGRHGQEPRPRRRGKGRCGEELKGVAAGAGKSQREGGGEHRVEETRRGCDAALGLEP